MIARPCCVPEVEADAKFEHVLECDLVGLRHVRIGSMEAGGSASHVDESVLQVVSFVLCLVR